MNYLENSVVNTICPKIGCGVQSTNSTPCVAHKCAGWNCLIPSREDTGNCARHMCVFKGCKKPLLTAYYSTTCEIHKCQYSANCSAKIEEGYKYCVYHKCKEPECSNIATTCKHKCSLQGCIEPKKHNLDFCEMHLCKLNYCVFPALFIQNKFRLCSKHTCRQDQCFEKKVDGKHYCYAHLPKT